MVNVPVARRYARALLETAGAEADEVLSQLEALVGFLESHPDVFATVASPALPRSQRLVAVDAVVRSAAGLNPRLVNLLKLLSDRNRLATLPLLLRQYRDLVDARMGRVRGKVTAAVKLGDAQLDGIRQSLEAMTQRKVVLDAQVDPALLGGVVAQVGSKVFDGSLRAQLKELGRTLAPGR